MKEDIKDFLADVLKAYADIPEDEIDMLIPKIKMMNVNKNSYFLHQGDNINRFGLIRNGLFRIYCIDMSGDEKTLAFRNQGQFLAGYTPHIENRNIWYSIQAIEDSEIIFFKFEDFLKQVNHHPCWNELIKNYITKLFIEKEERERSFLLDDATTRYLDFLKKFPDYENKISQYHIASYLGITAVSLSRIRSKIKKAQHPELLT